MKTPLMLITWCYILAFCDGLLSLGFSDSMYYVIGLTSIAAIVWMWIEFRKL